VTDELRGELVVLRPLDAEDADTLSAIASTPEVVRWWGRQDESFPLSDEPSATRFAIVVDGAIAGLIQYGEATPPPSAATRRPASGPSA